MQAFERFVSTLHVVKARALLIIGIVSLVSACTSPSKNISESIYLGVDRGYLTDAKSRVILSQNPSLASRPGAIYPRRITCVEPHPDVATAVANSFGVGLTIFGSPSSISKSQAQGLAQIAQRTASIQALQRLMFRACEAYANGAITGTGYSLLLSEINKTIVTLILGETAGGRFGQSGVSIGGKAFATASVEISELEGMLKELKDSQGAVGEATAELQESTEKAETTTSIATKDGTVTTPEAEAVDEANQEVKQDTESLADATKRMERATKALTAAGAEISKVEGLGQRDVTPSGEVASTLEMMQQNFLSSGNTQNYISACLIELGIGSEPVPFSYDIFHKDKPMELKELFQKLVNQRKKKFEFQRQEAEIQSGLTGQMLSESSELKSVQKKIKSLDAKMQVTKEKITDKVQTLSSSNLVEVQSAAKDALKKLASSENGIRSGDLRAFVYRIYHLNRKTGLYAHCSKYLAGFLGEVNSLKQKRIEHNAALKEKMVDAAVTMAGAIKNDAAAKFAFCHLLPDTKRRRECVADLNQPGAPPPKPDPPPTKGTDPEDGTPKSDLPGTVSVAHQRIRSLEASLPELIVQLGKLNALKGGKIKAPSHAKPEELLKPIKKQFNELVNEQAKLNKSLSDEVTKSDSVKTTVMELISSAPDQLNNLLKLYNDAVSDQTRADSESKKLLDANIESYIKQAEALELLAKTRVLVLKQAIKDVANLVERIEQHNAAVDAFKTS